MKVIAARSIMALAIVGMLGVGAPAVASAKGTTTTTTTIKVVSPMRAYEKALGAYKFARASIGHSYQSAVQAAQSVYDASLAVARDSAERSTAREVDPAVQGGGAQAGDHRGHRGPRGGASRPG